MNIDHCLRCGQAGHCSEDCPLSGARVSRGASIAYAGFLLLVALLSLVGVAAKCADAFAYPTFGSFK
jgi:hypothetical protein